MNFAPTPKVTLGLVAGALTTIIVGELHRHGIELSPDEASAFTVLFSFGASWLGPRSQTQTPPQP